MIETHWWQDSPIEALKAFVREHRGKHSGAHPLLPEFYDHHLIKRFHEYCISVFDELEIPHVRWRFWVSMIDPCETEWAPGFPHIHGWDGYTVIHYLQPALEGGELYTREKRGPRGADPAQNPWTIIEPQAGMSVIIDGDNEHGVKGPISSPRLTVIATGFQS